MSTHIIKYTELYKKLEESIDFENAKAIPLNVDKRSRANIEGLNVGIELERFPEGYELYFRPNTILRNKFNNKGYYNLGFDIDESTTQVQKSDYKTLSKILGVVVKSTLEWIKQNKPDVITMIPEGGSDKEFEKKLSIYYSILYNNKDLLTNIGYVVDKGKIATGKSMVYIANKELYN
jgi:hypothetical protein